MQRAWPMRPHPADELSVCITNFLQCPHSSHNRTRTDTRNSLMFALHKSLEIFPTIARTSCNDPCASATLG
eukprot:4761294-Lingulodinium_polyedra.AAC.1